MQYDKIKEFLKSFAPSRHSSFPGLLLGAFLFIFLAFFTGFGSAWYMLEKGTPLTRHKFGPWQNWHTQGAVNSDPYTKAYIARSGRLPLNSQYAQYFKATTDSDGDRLTSHCSYILRGTPIASEWWSIGLYDNNAEIIFNKAQRHAFNSKNIARLEDGGYIIRIASFARPDNWLPSENAGKLVLLIRVYGILASDDTSSGNVISASLPTIKKVRCS